MKVLIVDDSKENIYLLETILASEGFEVVSASNGAEALKKLESEDFQLIISDILMPVMDGFQFCRQCKEKAKFKDIPFVFYTATYTDKKDEQFALKLGANKFIRKPIEPDKFIRVVKNILDDAENGKLKPVQPPLQKDADVFKLYSERLVQKLEKKMLDLETELKKRKKAEQHLQESLEQLNIVFNGVSDGIVLSKIEHDGRYRILNVNEAFANNIGLKKEKIIGKTIDQMLPPEEYAFGKQKCDEAIEAKKPLGYEKEYTTSQGMAIIESVNFPVFNQKGDCSHFIFLSRNVTERKQAEEKLRASEEKYASVVETSKDGIIIHKDGIIKFANKATFQLIGYTSNEIINRNIMEFIHPKYQQIVGKYYANRKEGEEVPSIYEIELLKKDGTSLPVEINATIMNYEGEQAALVFLRDISLRKQAEIEIKKRQRYLESVLYNTPSAIVTLDANHKIVEWNPAAENIFKHKRDDVVGIDLDELLTTPTTEAEAKTFTDQVLSGKKVLQQEIIRYNKDKQPVDLMLSGSSILIDGETHGAVAVYTDITERIRADEQIRSDLKEKETLLKEIHHRVKNNLQVISSMLYLQSGKMKDLQSALSLQVGIRRIHSMALIHEKLYESKSLAKINFSDYIIEMTKGLLGFYDVSEKNIKAKFNLQDIFLGIDSAIPCGLIINELITNCLKYAFPENRKGTIAITFKKMEEYLYKLIVKDDGVGIDEKIDLDKIDTLGLKLVKILAQQIEGSVAIEREKGTTVTVTFRGYEYAKTKYSQPQKEK
ncbi:PAS domain S-box protein [candidate division KSB1 bacterium]|nr:PAS domain S-box protein [candidate division KSB1 bacterium]